LQGSDHEEHTLVGRGIIYSGKLPFTLTMEAVDSLNSFEISIKLYQNARRHIPEDSNLAGTFCFKSFETDNILESK
jgi:hypothetical protein